MNFITLSETDENSFSQNEKIKNSLFRFLIVFENVPNLPDISTDEITSIVKFIEKNFSDNSLSIKPSFTLERLYYGNAILIEGLL